MQIKLIFAGGAGSVTGSRYVVEANNIRFLVDCGLHQEREFLSRNWEPFFVPPSSLDAVLLTHAHVDHCGLLPKLVKEGFQGKIICTEATADIARIILADAAHLQEEDAAYKAKRHQREKRQGPHPEVPLYTAEDAEATYPLFAPVDYDQAVTVGEGITAVFRDAGHVLGSSMIKVTVNQGNERRSIVFSGDIGRWDRPILQDPTLFNEVDYILVESTYGDRIHPEPPDVGGILANIVNDTWKARGNIIVPSFALQRSQEILYHLNELVQDDLIPEIPVFLDSPMAVKITEVFKRHADLYDREMASLVRHDRSPFDFPGLKLVQTVEESKAINEMEDTIMVIAGSGMCNGGRIKHHLVANISRPESTILFVGYQAIGTLGRRIVDGADEVRIFGQQHKVKARIAQIHGFSAHADRDELLRWLSSIKNTPRQVFVVHGEGDSAHSFGRYVQEKTGWKVTVPQHGDEVILD